MLYLIWLPLIPLRSLLAGYFGYETLAFTIVLNLVLMLDFFLVVLQENFKVHKIVFFLLMAAVIVLFNKAALALLDIVVAVYILRYVRLERVIKLMASVSLFYLCFFYSLYFFEIKQNVEVIMPKGVAYSLGFNNTNTASAFFMLNIMVVSLYLYNVKKIYSFLLLPVLYVIYNLTLGRTSFYAELVFYISAILLFAPPLRKIRLLYKLFPILLFSTLLILTSLSNHYSAIDDIFTTRFSIYSNLLGMMQPTNYLTGLAIPEDQPMDSSFFALLFDGGITYLLLFFYLYNIYYKNSIRNNDFHYMPFVLFMLATGFSENTFSSFNVLSVIFFKILYDSAYSDLNNRLGISNREWV